MVRDRPTDVRTIDLAHQALAYSLSQPREIAIVGDPETADTQALLSAVRDGYRPFQVVALRSPDDSNATDCVGSIAAAPLLQDRGLVEGHAAACICRDFVCQVPVTDTERLREQLELGWNN